MLLKSWHSGCSGSSDRQGSACESLRALSLVGYLAPQVKEAPLSSTQNNKCCQHCSGQSWGCRGVGDRDKGRAETRVGVGEEAVQGQEASTLGREGGCSSTAKVGEARGKTSESNNMKVRLQKLLGTTSLVWSSAWPENLQANISACHSCAYLNSLLLISTASKNIHSWLLDTQ